MTVVINETDIQLPELGATPTAITEAGSILFFIDNTGKSFTLNPNGSPVDVSGNTSTLTDFTDITITTPVNDHILRYRTGVWVNEVFPTIPVNISDLTDVSTTGVINGDVLVRIGGNYEANVLQPAVLAKNTTLTAINDQTGATTLANVVKVATAGDGNVTNAGDTAQDLLSTNYFQNFNNGTSEDVGIYQITGVFEFTVGADAGSHDLSIYFAEVNTGVVSFTQILESFVGLTVSTKKYVMVSWTLQPTAGREYSFSITTVNDFNLNRFDMSWRKLGHAIV